MKKHGMKKIGWTVVFASILFFFCVSLSFAETFTWKFSSYVPAANKSLAVGQKWWAEEIEKRSNGQIKIQIFWSKQLSGEKEMMQAVRSGLADVVGHAPVYTPGETPVWNLPYLPFLAPSRVDQTLLVYNRLARESKPFQDELERFNCVYGGSHDSSSNNAMGKKPIHSLADMKNLRIRCMPDLGRIFKEHGATIVSVPVTETYTALDTGMIDVVVFGTEGFRTWKVDEISRYLTLDMDMGALPSFYFINKKSWEKLPDNLKKVVRSVIDDQPAFVGALVEKLKKETLEMVKEKKIEVSSFPKEDRDALVARAAAVWEESARRTGSYEVNSVALKDYQRIRDEVAAKFPKGVSAGQ
jgi:TRAP-type C4-dicarboxylate transport system substrate-binding protein